MNRHIWFFHRVNWMDPAADAAAIYGRAVLRRIVRQGYQVTWVSRKWSGKSPVRSDAPVVSPEGIRLVCLGGWYAYPWLAKVLLREMAHRNVFQEGLHAACECMTGRMHILPVKAPLPVVRLVVDARSLLPKGSWSGIPVITATEQARDRVIETGVDARQIIRAPFGSLSEGSRGVPLAVCRKLAQCLGDETVSGDWEHTAGTVSAVFDNLPGWHEAARWRRGKRAVGDR